MVQVRRAMSEKATAAAVAAELAQDSGMDDAAFALVFASPHLDPSELARELQSAFGDIPVYGSTTAGEIGPGGFGHKSAVAMTVASEGIRAAASLRHFSSGALRAGREAAAEALERVGPGKKRLGLAMVDPYTRAEESFVAGAAASALRFVGGAASNPVDGPRLAHVFFEGRAEKDCGMVLALAFDVPASIVVTDHMTARDERIVVTRSDPQERVVYELNGRPAMEVFCELYGLEDPSIQTVGIHPFIQMVGGRPYVRSVMAASGSALLFACAVSDGVVLRATSRGDMLAVTQEALRRAEAEVGGKMSALIAFQCLGRYLESQIFGLRRDLSDLFARYPVVGLHTLAEIAGAVHVNHTLTALAIGDG